MTRTTETSPERRPLTQREREVLETIVRQYVQFGSPVGSRTVSKTNSESLSPATIRSIMSDLEDSGLITHPHTSAGRIPTDLGFRLYVDTLDAPARLSAEEREALADHLYAAGGLDSFVARCCSLLSAATNQIAVGTAPDLRSTVFRHVELFKLNDERVLVLFIAASGVVHQHVIDMRVPESQADLDRHAAYLNAELHGRTLPEVRDHLATLMRHERVLYDSLARRALELAAQYFTSNAQTQSELYVGGAERFFERPDLSDFDRMKSLVVALEEKSRIIGLLNSCLARDGVTTAIGSETQAPELAGCSIIATSYGYDATRIGTLGIIGPTRMDYDRARALVACVAELLGSALASAKD